jgi:ATP-dependent DNA ligase
METDTQSFFDSIRSKQCDDAWLPEQLHSLDSQDWVAEPKFDGFRLVAVVYETTVGFFTREMKRQDGKLEHIKEELMEKFPVGTVLDGEITAMRSGEGGKIDNRFEWVQSVMLSKPERAMSQQRDNNDWLTFMVFDILQWGKDDIRDQWLSIRRSVIEKKFVENHPWKHVALSPHLAPSETTYNHLTALGFEGIVVKRLSSTYFEKKAWYKVKAQHPIDCVVLGFTDGDGKYTGQIGALEFGQPWDETEKGLVNETKAKEFPRYSIDGRIFVKRGQCSGMNDALRLEMTEKREELVGSVVEIAHMGIYPNGITTRHPQFKRYRWDKPVAEVKWHDR